jgi:hypothetical protein
MKHKAALAALGCSIFLFVGEEARASLLGPELLINGSFEDPNITTGTFSVFASIPGWTSTTVGGGIEIQDHVAGSPFAGEQHVELDSFSSSNMFQDVGTQSGELYHISFAYSPRPGVNPNNIHAFWDGQPLVLLNGNGTGLSDTSWQIFSFDEFATGSSTRLEFLDIGQSDSLGGYLDAVSLRQVIPEPGTLLFLGFAAFLIRTRHRGRAR